MILKILIVEKMRKQILYNHIDNSFKTSVLVKYLVYIPMETIFSNNTLYKLYMT